MFENLFKLLNSTKIIEEAGSNIAGFNLENWIAAIGGGFAAGSNTELEDIIKIKKDADGKIRLEGFGLKLKGYKEE